MKKPPIKRDIIFVYSENENKDYITAIAKEKNQSVSFIINYLIDNFKKNVVLQKNLKLKVPAFVEKTKAWEAKNVK